MWIVPFLSYGTSVDGKRSFVIEPGSYNLSLVVGKVVPCGTAVAAVLADIVLKASWVVY